MTTIDLDSFVLSHGSHSSIEEGACIMELAAYLAGQPFSDHPACVSPILGAFLRSWNDALADEPRQKLKPYAKRVLGTAGDREADEKRAWLATDWLVRTCAPAFLDLAGLTDAAAAMRALPEVVDDATAASVQHVIKAAESAAWSAAGSAAGSAAWSAARSAAWSAARSAAWSAAWSAARSAADACLAPTVADLQVSAFDLVDRMISVGETS